MEIEVEAATKSKEDKELDRLKEKTCALEARISRIVEELIEQIESKIPNKPAKRKYVYRPKKELESK